MQNFLIIKISRWFFNFSGSILAIPWVHKQCILQFCGRKDSPLDLVDTCVSKSTMYMDHMLLHIEYIFIYNTLVQLLIYHKSLSIIYISIILYLNFFKWYKKINFFKSAEYIQWILKYWNNFFFFLKLWTKWILCMVAFFCPHLLDNYYDLSDLYVD